ncbi:MAG: hypothetical protein JSU87_02685 [Gemmatimonadota bacterium]|nr:MAG: hypothetical protein JSU87_02685 [Gemmatimonadota bacterium]
MMVGAAHSYLGERYIIIRLLRREGLPHLFGSDLFTRRTLRFAWHLTTVAWWGFGALLWRLATAVELGMLGRNVATMIGWTFLVSAVVALVGSRGRHLSWLVFLAIASAAWLGTQ